jgi:hypothetical protein
MFTTLTGQEVHLGETAQHVALLSATVPARSVTDLMPGLDAHIASVIDRALAFDKASRWPDAATMRDAVADAYASSFGEPIGRGPLGGGAGVGATTGSSVVQDESVDVRAHAATAVGPEGQPPRQPPVTPARERRDRAGMRRVGMSTEEPVSGMPLTGRTSGAVRGAVVLVALLSVGGVAIFLLRSRAPDGGGLASGVVASAWGAAAVPTSSPPREEPGAEPKAPPTSNTANTAPSSVTAPSAAHPAHAHDAGSAKPKTKDWDLQ